MARLFQWKFIALYIQSLWKKTICKQKLSHCERIFFIMLCCIEYSYRWFFYVHQYVRKHKKKYKVPNAYVISVGNISVGGTGKSVVAAFLVDLLNPSACGVILRGYGKKDKQPALLVGDGKRIITTVENAGDEALMAARNLGCTVAVGSNRKMAIQIVYKNIHPHPVFFILDDAYQNHALVKDLEIVLLDATAPYGNGHCLPAGPLREKDLSRADCVFITHADNVVSHDLAKIKNDLQTKIPQALVVATKHVIKKIYNPYDIIFDNKEASGCTCLVVAAIGNFSHFLSNIKNCGFNIGGVCEYPDHHAYTRSDLIEIIATMKNTGASYVITTQKDWEKLGPLVHMRDDYKKFFLITTVSIEFLSYQEYSFFTEFLKKRLCE
ncbi:MAG: Tetraacyldisaccharide 4'-kinase [candidate division TM6 bacterium GW2011_GWF2_38_10]|nr:MAG: Tetraacyldisaccharide 4'-kinase [candidate division TM6 bacterium GW2011_GWF2_38_10]